MNNFFIITTCRLCGEEHKVFCKKEDFYNWKQGKFYIQDALHYLSADQRELLISNICGKCFNSLFPPEEHSDEEEA